MTVSTTTNREQYATNGSTVDFTIHFPFFDDTDVNAIFVDSLGNSTTLALSADFTVVGGDGAGGTLTTMVAQANGGTLTIYRDIPFTQEDDYVENDPLPADTLEGGFDRAAMRDQQLKDALDRALVLPVTTSASGGTVPSPVADKFLGWNSAADALENKDLPAGTAVYSSIANTRAGTVATEAVTPDGLASLWQEGSALVSASSIAKPADANLGGYYTQSGNTGTNTYWAGVKGGEAMQIRYTGTPLLGTGGNLVPPGAASYQTIAGDIIAWRWDASATKWRAVGGIRADGTALVAAGPGGYVAKIATYAATSADNNKTIDFTTAGASLTLPAAASNSGLKLIVKNSAAASDVTIDPNAAETLDGLATRLLRPGDRVTIQCTGAAWITLNGEYSYDSGEQTITDAATLTLAHGLGVVPIAIEVWARCKTNDSGYVVGEEIMLVPINYAGVSIQRAMSVRRDATNIKVVTGSAGFGYSNPGTGNEAVMTSASWKYLVRARAK